MASFDSNNPSCLNPHYLPTIIHPRHYLSNYLVPPSNAMVPLPFNLALSTENYGHYPEIIHDKSKTPCAGSPGTSGVTAPVKTNINGTTNL